MSNIKFSFLTLIDRPQAFDTLTRTMKWGNVNKKFHLQREGQNLGRHQQ
jgi:hypothetical protein